MNSTSAQQPMPSAVRLLMNQEDVTCVLVVAPGSPSPRYEGQTTIPAEVYGDTLTRSEMLDGAIRIAVLTEQREIQVQLSTHWGLKVVRDERGFFVASIYRRGPMVKSIARSLRRVLKRWPSSVSRPPGRIMQ